LVKVEENLVVHSAFSLRELYFELRLDMAVAQLLPDCVHAVMESHSRLGRSLMMVGNEFCAGTKSATRGIDPQPFRVNTGTDEKQWHLPPEMIARTRFTTVLGEWLQHHRPLMSSLSFSRLFLMRITVINCERYRVDAASISPTGFLPCTNRALTPRLWSSSFDKGGPSPALRLYNLPAAGKARFEAPSVASISVWRHLVQAGPVIFLQNSP
jgi:hypothetical protein